MRKQACLILGVAENATPNEIKTAYKSLVKLYHPDSGASANVDYYNNVVWAYQYLKDNPVPLNVGYNPGYNKVLGSPKSFSNTSYAKAAEYAQFQKGYQRKRQERMEEFEDRIKEQKARQEEYDRAMEAINAIRVAEAIKTLINSSNQS